MFGTEALRHSGNEVDGRILDSILAQQPLAAALAEMPWVPATLTVIDFPDVTGR
ncbi:hypothetical protein [Streptomyces griseorubiginosus]|uniref:hypothetical protein n=1 Tax=Streptomyces griseorubiginosus TaxID=67304 RepID=UPI000A602186|nr:hypothetical protein [Streptomyces griseorubiginosus]